MKTTECIIVGVLLTVGFWTSIGIASCLIQCAQHLKTILKGTRVAVFFSLVREFGVSAAWELAGQEIKFCNRIHELLGRE